jgi:anaphase-promoting complex subunit 4
MSLLVHIIRITLVLENGISTVQGLDSSVLQFGDGQIKDVKFADGYTMLVLWESKG